MKRWSYMNLVLNKGSQQGRCNDVLQKKDQWSQCGTNPNDSEGGARTPAHHGRFHQRDKKGQQKRVQRRSREVQEVDGRVRLHIISWCRNRHVSGKVIAKFNGHHVFFDLQVDKWWILFSYFQYQRQIFSTWLSIHLLVLSVLIYRMIIYLRLKVCILYVQSVMVDWISIIWNWSLYFVTILKSNKISIACTYLFVIIFPAIQSLWANY